MTDWTYSQMRQALELLHEAVCNSYLYKVPKNPPQEVSSNAWAIAIKKFSRTVQPGTTAIDFRNAAEAEREIWRVFGVAQRSGATAAETARKLNSRKMYVGAVAEALKSGSPFADLHQGLDHLVSGDQKVVEAEVARLPAAQRAWKRLAEVENAISGRGREPQREVQEVQEMQTPTHEVHEPPGQPSGAQSTARNSWQSLQASQYPRQPPAPAATPAPTPTATRTPNASASPELNTNSTSSSTFSSSTSTSVSPPAASASAASPSVSARPSAPRRAPAQPTPTPRVRAAPHPTPYDRVNANSGVPSSSTSMRSTVPSPSASPDLSFDTSDASTDASSRASPAVPPAPPATVLHFLAQKRAFPRVLDYICNNDRVFGVVQAAIEMGDAAYVEELMAFWAREQRACGS